MKSKVYILIVLVLASTAMLWLPYAQAHENKEYSIKAAFLYNFIKFVDWPEEFDKNKDTITLTIIGESPFAHHFDPIKDKKIKNKKLRIRYFEGYEEIEDKSVLKECHLLFVCLSEREHLKEIIKSTEGGCVLTVSEVEGFLEAGGVIRFVMHDKKVGFEINITAVERNKLKIRSQLLRLAKKVVEEKKPKESEPEEKED